MIKTFDDILFPLQMRWEYALGNVASDSRGEFDKKQFNERAPRLYPGFNHVAPHPRIGVMNLMIPVGCNATCPNICYTDIGKRRRTTEHLTFRQILGLLEQFRSLGGKLVRIVGDGEPVLYRELPQLCQWVWEKGLNLVIFSNGVLMPQSMLQEYERGNLYFYIKLWSERIDVQKAMVAPKIPYRYQDGDIGLAPSSFYQLYEIDLSRVGFQVMFSSLNEEDAWRIVQGPKSKLPLLVENFIAQGAGAGHTELTPRVVSPATKACTQPERSSYLCVVNSCGRLQAGTFVPEGAIPIIGQLTDVWSSIFTSHEPFFEARYPAEPGCFCERFRSQHR
ncbi:MAG: radical SAM protein [Patescibacteria group bacterium]